MRVIKKYANRKLYDTQDKTYISMDRLAELIKAGEEISVVDNQTDQDITVSVLSQLLAREKQDGEPGELSDLLSSLLRKGGGTVLGYAKKYTSRWQSAMTLAEDELEKFTRLLFKGREDVDAADQEKITDTLRGQAEKMKRWVGEKVDQRVGDLLGVMKLVTRDEFDAAAAEVAALKKRLADLEGKGGEKVSPEP